MKRLNPDNSELLVADLNTFLDLATLWKFVFSRENGNPDTVVEVGGGYGRLAEGLLSEFQDVSTLVEVDSVVDSLCYCYGYLDKAFPDRNVTVFGYNTDSINQGDVVICPSWRIPELGLDSADLFINISSFQEMYDEQVNMYLQWWESLAREDSVFYVANSRDFFYRRDYVYPPGWELLYKARTPRSNTPDFPAEILRRLPAGGTADNDAVENRYRRELIPVYREALAREKELKQAYMRSSQAKQKIIDAGRERAAAEAGEQPHTPD